MHRPLWARAASMLFGLWFAVAMAEPAALHACPVHDGPLAHAHGGADAQTDVATGRHGAAQHHGGHGREAPHHCTCPGACCTVTAAKLDAPIALVLPAVAIRAEVFAPAEVAFRPTSPEHARPPSLGPPPRSHSLTTPAR